MILRSCIYSREPFEIWRIIHIYIMFIYYFFVKLWYNLIELSFSIYRVIFKVYLYLYSFISMCKFKEYNFDKRFPNVSQTLKIKQLCNTIALFFSKLHKLSIMLIKLLIIYLTLTLSFSYILIALSLFDKK